MPDQATELRRLVRQAHAAGVIAGYALPRLVAVAGGQGGVGTTTIAVNLAVGLARQGHRAVLADVALAGSGAAVLCRRPGRRTLADFVVVDVGNSPNETARRLWHASDLVLLVTTPDLTSVMNAYAAVKALGAGGTTEIQTVVNMAPTAAVADEIHARLALACRRFLGLALRPAGCVHPAKQVQRAGRRGEPFLLRWPACPASRQIGQLARRVVGRGENKE